MQILTSLCQEMGKCEKDDCENFHTPEMVLLNSHHARLCLKHRQEFEEHPQALKLLEALAYYEYFWQAYCAVLSNSNAPIDVMDFNRKTVANAKERVDLHKTVRDFVIAWLLEPSVERVKGQARTRNQTRTRT